MHASGIPFVRTVSLRYERERESRGEVGLRLH